MKLKSWCEIEENSYEGRVEKEMSRKGENIKEQNNWRTNDEKEDK